MLLVKVPNTHIAVASFIYNHVTNDWDAIEPEQVANGLVTFKTQVLGLFRAGVAK
jgi:hypothetical protein